MYVAVGPNQQRFGVFKARISRFSTFFKAAFSGSFKEASSDVVLLPDDDPEIFDIVQVWLNVDWLTQFVNGKHIDCTSRQLIDVFIFGDKYGMPELRNAAINYLIEWVVKKEGLIPHFAHAYKQTTADSSLRRLLVDVFTYLPTRWAEIAREHHDVLSECPDFVIDIATALADRVSRRNLPSAEPPPFFHKPCDYHDHGEGVEDCLRLEIPKNPSLSSLKLVQD